MPINIPVVNKPRIVIIGGGFAGLALAKKIKGDDVQIVLIDKNNYHAFQPLLYQVATAGLEPDSIAYPLRKIFKHQHNVHFRLAEVLSIEPNQRMVVTSIGDVTFDYLVIATGSRTDFFGMDDLRQHAMPMKTIPEALDLRSLILQNFEAALLSLDVKEREGLMTFVVVGGGPTGVEMAGALGELKNHILPTDYPELDLNRMQIHIIDLADRLLPAMSKESSQKAQEFLKEYNIHVWLKTKVNSYDGRVVFLSNQKQVDAKTVIWAAGVQGATLPGVNEALLTRNKRIKVDQFNRLEGYENIFALGDVATMVTEDTPQGHPMLAPVAKQQAEHLAKNLRNILNQKPLRPFQYHNPGVMATVGRNQAVVDLPFIKFAGILGWLTWLFVHLMVLVGFRNRLITFVNWVWSYLSYDRGIRLIIRPFRKK